MAMAKSTTGNSRQTRMKLDDLNSNIINKVCSCDTGDQLINFSPKYTTCYLRHRFSIIQIYNIASCIWFPRELQKGDSEHRQTKIKVNMWKKAQQKIEQEKQKQIQEQMAENSSGDEEEEWHEDS